MGSHSTRGAYRGVATLVAVLAVVAAACSSGGGASTAPGAGASGTVHVAIVNKDMTPDQVTAAVKAEGGLTVGNWTYAATDELVKQFEAYVKTTYGADVKLTYAGTQAPNEYLTKLAAAKQANNPAPYDVIAVEENYWYNANQQGLVDDVPPSGLIPNHTPVPAPSVLTPH